MRIIFYLIVSFTTTSLLAQEQTFEQKREFVRKFLLRNITDPDQLADAELNLSRIESPGKVDALYAAAYQRTYQLEVQKLQKLQAYRDHLRGQVQQTIQQQPGGFQPWIGWLPSGTQLGVGAVVSPDRRYVRINVNALFSSFQGFQHFNYRRPHQRQRHHHHHR